jgi:hypothetical protein
VKGVTGPDRSEPERPGRRSAARRGGGMGKLGPVGDSGERTLGSYCDLLWVLQVIQFGVR